MSLNQALFSPGEIQELSAASVSVLPEPEEPAESPGAPSPAGAQGSCHSTPSHCWLGLLVQVPSLPDSASEFSVRTGLLISSKGWGGQLQPQMFMMFFFP